VVDHWNNLPQDIIAADSVNIFKSRLDKFGRQSADTKIVWGMENLDYEERLNRLGLMRLDRRRVRSDLLETFKIINGYYNLTADTFDDSGRRGHSKKLFMRRSRLDVRKYAFANRIVGKWNGISPGISPGAAAPIAQTSTHQF